MNSSPFLLRLAVSLRSYARLHGYLGTFLAFRALLFALASLFLAAPFFVPPVPL